MGAVGTTVPVSLITTVLNEAASIGWFLDSLHAQDTTAAEFVIVDGGSTDGTVDLLRAWSAPTGMTVRVIELRGANISEGRNAAIAAASHDLIAVSDAGTELHPAWLSALVAGFAPGVDVVSGFFECRGRTFKQQLIGSVITPLIGEISPEQFLPSSRSVAFRKSAWAAVNGYPEWLDYCEDLVYDLALLDRGATFAFAPTALATWDARPSYSAFAKQYYRYARGDGKAGLWAKRHTIRYVMYGVAIVTVVLLPVSPWPAAVAAALAVAYLAKFWGRVYRSRALFGATLPGALALVPFVVALGDSAKMVGYPRGLSWRRTHRARLAAQAPAPRAVS